MTKARFHLPGLRYNYPLNMFWLSMLEQYPHYFKEGVEIASFFGEFPTSIWNGGRLSLNDQCDAGFVKMVVKNINARGIPVRFTYTNPLLKEEDLDDPYCNFCMQVADNGMNEVIVFSPILEEYIREKYPSFKLNSTTCKGIKDIETLNAELDKDYHFVVLDYNLNNRWDLLAQVNKPEKLEILINSTCVPNCPRRAAHYQNVGINERIILENRKLPKEQQKPIIPWLCDYGERGNISNIINYPTVVKPDDIYEKYIPMGINNFKIEGRNANLFMLIDTYCTYMIKPEYFNEARLLLIGNLTDAKVITINKPRPSHWP